MKEKKNRGVKRDGRRGERGPWGREREREQEVMKQDKEREMGSKDQWKDKAKS